MRSLHRALTRGGASRRIVEPDAGPPLAADAEEGNTQAGTTCILHSPSDKPRIEARGSMPHEIGMTGGSIERRIANARLKPTYFTADVEITRTDKLIHVDRSRFETLMGGGLDATRTEIEVVDWLGRPMAPTERFPVPPFVIGAAVARIRTGTIAQLLDVPMKLARVER